MVSLILLQALFFVHIDATRRNFEFLRAKEIAQNETLKIKLEILWNRCNFTAKIKVFNYGLCFDFCEEDEECVALTVTNDYTHCSLCVKSDHQVIANYNHTDLELTYVLMEGLHAIEARNCKDVSTFGHITDGIYSIDPDGQGSFNAFCELNSTRNDGTNETGWTVFQRRVDNTIDFYRDWDQYEAGFGDIEGNYWMGLKNIHRLTAAGPVQLHVYLETFENEWAYALYDEFVIAGVDDNYRLTVSGYSGTAGDSLDYHKNMQFTTQDRDNDHQDNNNCAVRYHGAWWYNNCHHANLNGLYLGGADDLRGVSWFRFRMNRYSLKTSVMKIRPL